MTPLRGWGPKGKRLHGFAPHGRWRTLTFLGALRCDRLTAPCVFDGPINGECFRAYVSQQLIPTLKSGDIVIADNLGSHKSKAILMPSRRSGQGCGSCRNTRPTSIRSNRHSPKSSIGCAKLKSEPARIHGAISGTSSKPSNQTNAKTTSAMQDTLQSKHEPL